MAKKKPDDAAAALDSAPPMESEAATPPAEVTIPPVDPQAEIEALKKRIAELEGSQQPAPVMPAVPVDPGNLVPGLIPDKNPTHTVSVKDAPTVQVHAPDSANAIQRYREKTGMIQTANQFVVSAVSA